MAMPGRKFAATSEYRYGFNGQEKSNDVTEGNYTAMYWEYDSRTGRRWNVDPINKPQLSPYSTFAGNPIWLSDHLGNDTLKITGANNSKLTVFWGEGTAVHTFDLKKNRLTKKIDVGNQTINLGPTPDAIGLDLGGNLRSRWLSAGTGLNLIWHTRGEKKDDQWTPEIHTYAGAGGSVANGVGSNASAGVAASIFWAYGEKNVNGQVVKVEDSWVANGFNWTGNFYSLSGSLGGGYQISFSKFRSLLPNTDLKPGEYGWTGYSIGFGVGKSSGSGLKVQNVIDVIKSASGTWLSQYYWMIYGNGSDKLPNKNKDVTRWNLWNPVDPKDDQ